MDEPRATWSLDSHTLDLIETGRAAGGTEANHPGSVALVVSSRRHLAAGGRSLFPEFRAPHQRRTDNQGAGQRGEPL